jgi:hypothetical protein
MRVQPIQPHDLQCNVRRIKDGDWYWISRSILKEHASNIGLLALGVYHVLASMVNEKQSCFPSQTYIARYLGCSRTSVNRAIKILKKNRLIAVDKSNKHHCTYFLLEIISKNNTRHMSKFKTSPVSQNDTNDNHITKYNNDEDEYSVEPLDIGKKKPRHSQYDMLAQDLAEGLGDMNHLNLYRKYALQYSESFLRRILSEVKQTPIHKIKKSRGALFTYLIHHYGDKNT